MSCCGTYSIMEFKTFASYGTVKIEVLVPRMGVEKGIYVLGENLAYNVAYALVKNKNAKILVLEDFKHGNTSNKSEPSKVSTDLGAHNSETKSIETSTVSEGELGVSGSIKIEGDRISSLSGKSESDPGRNKETRSKRGRKPKSSSSSEENKDKEKNSDSLGETPRGKSVEQTVS